MPKDESLQHKLDRVRPPRVQITYDVQVGDAQIKKELPFVVGVLADLAGHPDPDEEPLPDLKDEKRKFVEINRDNFDRVMGGMKPRLAMKVENKIEKDNTKVGVELKFHTLDDFEPVNVVNQVEPLRKLLEARQRLSELKSKITTNDRFDALLQRIIHDTDQLKRLGRETGRFAEAPSQAGSEPETEPAPAEEENES
ncbi:MAG: type VI secretion system contractile sheath small subunit [Isosphaeraceae bacterium]|jgi:type VI secretion system protein ImpB